MNLIMAFVCVILVCYMCLRAVQINIEAIQKIKDPETPAYKKAFGIFLGLAILVIYAVLIGFIATNLYDTYKIPY